MILSLGATAYIFWQVKTEEELVPDEGEAGLGLTVGQYGCRTDDDCVGQYVECDEVMSHDASKQRCEYYKCTDGKILSKDRLKCMEALSCGEYGCSEDSACVDANNECDERTDGDVSKQKCVLISCEEGYEMSDDECSCVEIVEETCGDGELNVTGEECESGDPSGVSCTWSECNQSTCTCPEEEEEPEEEPEEEEPETVVPDDDGEETSDTGDGEELPETGITDLPGDVMAFYIGFFISGGILILSYIFEGPVKKYENQVVDKFDK